MIFTRKLITRFIPDFDRVSDEELVKVVNSLGMEVESIKKYPKINNIIVGQLLSFEPVKGTHLNKCVVKVGEQPLDGTLPTAPDYVAPVKLKPSNEKTKSKKQINSTLAPKASSNTKPIVRNIVCGASGLIAGKFVLVALEGANMANGITIAKRQIHGLESNGMMCAYSELTGISDYVSDQEKDEIIMFDDGIIGSKDYSSIIGTDDTLYEVTVPANRNDENSYLIFCFEIANKLGLNYIVDFNALLPKQSLRAKKDLIVDEKICSFLQYTDVTINNQQNIRSTWELKSILMNSGIKPINALLDRLEYITLLTNCPTHAYDADKLNGKLTCKLAKDGTKFVALNGKEYKLSNEDVVVCDDKGPVSIACVIGGGETKVTNKTKIARIEIGNFQFANVRNTSLRLNISTDAAHRGSRSHTNYLNLLAGLLVDMYFDNSILKQTYFKPDWSSKTIDINYDALSWFIHEHLDKRFVVESLKKLGFIPTLLNKSIFTIPYWRNDIENPEDLYEEILKIIDINNLQSIEIEDKLLPLANNIEYDLKQSLKDILIYNHFNEVKTYNLTNKSNLAKFNLFNIDQKDCIRIQCNNLNREYFRVSLIDNMLKVYQYNAARKLELMPIFEIQKLFNNSNKWINLTALTLDEHIVDNVTHSVININSNTLKAICNEFAKILNAKLEYRVDQNNSFFPNECISIIWSNKVIGYIGKLKSSLLKDYDLFGKNIYALSININDLILNYHKPEFKVTECGAYQQLSKDINIVLDEKSKEDLNSKIQNILNCPDIVSTKLINIFAKDSKIIYTVRYYLTDKKQFNSEQINNIAKQVEELIK